MSEVRCKCGQLSDDWPGQEGSTLCQDCWEEECDKSWWDMVRAFEAAREQVRRKGEKR